MIILCFYFINLFSTYRRVVGIFKVYKYTNTKNNKVYIGQTKHTLEQRAKSNGENYKSCSKFYYAIKKYGWDNFVPEILKDDISLDEANYYEQYYIDLYSSTDDHFGYNLQSGGLNHEVSEEVKMIISKKAKERLKDKTKNPMYGRKHSDEAIHKMSTCKLGSNNPMYGSTWTETQRSAKRIGWCYEWTDEKRKIAGERLKKAVSKKVMCIEDEIEFNTVSEAADFYNVKVSTLSGHLHKYQKTCCGKHFKFI